MKETKKYDSINIKRNFLTKVPLYVIGDSVGVRTQDPQLRRLLL